MRPRYQPPPAQNVLHTSDSKVAGGSVRGYVLPSDLKIDTAAVGKKTQQLQGGQVMEETTLKKVITEPTLKKVITEPTLKKVITEPTLKKVITEPALTKIITEPTLKKVITEPTLKKVITEPTLMKIITDPTLKKVIGEPTDASRLSEDDTKNRAQNRRIVISQTENEEVTAKVSFGANFKICPHSHFRLASR
jgi:hypothetical protein